MRNDKHLAIKLRRQGKSYNKISKELEIPKTTLSSWFSDIEWSREIKVVLARKANYIAKKRLRIFNKKRRQMWEEWREKARQQAREDFIELSKNQLFIAGIMLYWGEGDSKIDNCIVRIANINSDMLNLFKIFLCKICYIPKEKIRVALTLYPDLSATECIEFWSKTIDLPTAQFIKPQFIRGKHPTKRLNHGICTIYFTSRQFKEKMFVWIDLFQKKINSAGVV